LIWQAHKKWKDACNAMPDAAIQPIDDSLSTSSDNSSASASNAQMIHDFAPSESDQQAKIIFASAEQVRSIRSRLDYQKSKIADLLMKTDAKEQSENEVAALSSIALDASQDEPESQLETSQDEQEAQTKKVDDFSLKSFTPVKLHSELEAALTLRAIEHAEQQSELEAAKAVSSMEASHA